MRRFLTLFFFLVAGVLLLACHQQGGDAAGKKASVDERIRTPLNLQLFLAGRLKESNAEEIGKKVDAFNKAANNAIWIDERERAREILPRAVTLADKLDPLDRAKKLVLIADTATLATDQQAAQEILKQTMSLAETLDEGDKAFLLGLIAMGMAQADEEQLSSQVFKQAVKASKGLKSGEKKVYAFSMAAIAASRIEDRRLLRKVVEAISQGKKQEPLLASRDTTLMSSVLESALDAAESLKGSERVWGVNWVASVYIESGMKEQGMAIFEKTLPWVEKLEGLDKAKRMKEMASTLLLAGEKQEANKLLEQASQAIRQSKNFSEIKKLRKDARATEKRGDKTRAEKMRQLAAMLDSATVDEWVSVAVATAETGDFKHALELSEELDSLRRIRVFKKIAELMVQSGDKAQALSTLRKAVPISFALQNGEKTFVLYEIADVLTQVEGKEFSPSGREFARKILEIALK